MPFCADDGRLFASMFQKQRTANKLQKTRQAYNAILEKEKHLGLEEAADDEPALLSKALFGDIYVFWNWDRDWHSRHADRAWLWWWFRLIYSHARMQACNSLLSILPKHKKNCCCRKSEGVLPAVTRGMVLCKMWLYGMRDGRLGGGIGLSARVHSNLQLFTCTVTNLDPPHSFFNTHITQT